MKFSDYLDSLKGKRVAVVGAGISNKPLINALLDACIDTMVCDKRTGDEIGEAADSFDKRGARLMLGDDYLADLGVDVIFRTPGLMPDNPALLEAVASGVVSTSEMEVFFDVCPCKIIAVTGSDGKTTTTSIIAQLLENQGFTVHVGGNIGRPLLCDADDMRPDDIAVLELSSFQLITMNKSPHIAVFTNLSPNHLDVHKNMDEYAEAKRNIFIHQNRSDRVVFNFDNNLTRAYASAAPGEVLMFSSTQKISDGVFTDGEKVYEASGGRYEAILQTSDIWLPGAHNVENFMAALAAVSGLVSHRVMLETARKFRGVRHRIELVRELRGVRFYNDSIASSPTRTIAGLRAFGQKVILIAGGKDKGISFENLGEEIVRHVKLLVLTGLTAGTICAVVEKARGSGLEPEILMCDEFEDAVTTAAKNARPGDVVLLSPACTSFDRFTNFEERGDRFREIVERIV